jgi:hypothetical protein
MRQDMTRTRLRSIGTAEMRETFDRFPAYWEIFARSSRTSIEEAKVQLKRNQELQGIFAEESPETVLER